MGISWNTPKNKRKKFVSELRSRYGRPVIDDKLKIHANNFLINSTNEFIEGHFNASVIFSAQAVELALLTEICRREEESGRLEEFKKSNKGRLSFGSLIRMLENNPKYRDILSPELLDKAKELKDFRNIYVHYINNLIYSIKMHEKAPEIQSELIKYALEKIDRGFNITIKRPFPLFEGKLRALEKEFKQIHEEYIIPLKLFDGLENFQAMETFESVRIKMKKEFLDEKLGFLEKLRTDESISQTLRKLPLLSRGFLRFLYEARFDKARPDYQFEDAKHVLEVSFEILGDLRYLAHR